MSAGLRAFLKQKRHEKSSTTLAPSISDPSTTHSNTTELAVLSNTSQTNTAAHQRRIETKRTGGSSSGSAGLQAFIKQQRATTHRSENEIETLADVALRRALDAASLKPGLANNRPRFTLRNSTNTSSHDATVIHAPRYHAPPTTKTPANAVRLGAADAADTDEEVVPADRERLAQALSHPTTLELCGCRSIGLLGCSGVLGKRFLKHEST